jgi:hypothetical protein
MLSCFRQKGIAYQMLLYHTSCYIVSVSDRNLLWAGCVSGVGGKIAKHLSDEDAAISYQMLYFMVSDEVLLVLIHLFGLVHYCLGFLYVNLPHKGL